MPAASYDTYKKQQAEISRERSASGRDIGGIPRIANVRRRSRCRKSLRLFCETYNPAAFWMGWSEDHRKAIARIEEAATLGALYAFALPRGSGKTTICRMAALWAVSYGHVRYAFVIGATDPKARETLNTIRVLIRFLPDYAADFPEISYPAQRLAGIANRATGQTCGGDSTLIEWSADRVVLPTVPPPENWPRSWALREDGRVPTSGVVVSASGLTGEGIRGSLKTLTTGEMVRPDFVLLDDPQTPESARSRAQNVTRLRLVAADVLGMAGPGKSIAAVMPCTVIERGDMVDEVLTREKHPLWRGERAGILRAMPADLAAWDDYFQEYTRCAQLEPPDFERSNAYYVSHREALDAGAVASWEDRKEEWEVSAIQSAMHLYCRDRRTFMAEYMNDPPEDDAISSAKSLTPADITQKLSRVPRGDVPREMTRLTAFIDCGGLIHWYVVVAWDERFNGSVVDYGTFPKQNRRYFEARDPRPSMADVPGWGLYSEPQRVHQGIIAVTGDVLGRAYTRAETGEAMRISRCLVDAGKWPDAVQLACRQSPHAAVLTPSKGYARTSNARPMSEWTRRPGERVGLNWRLSSLGGAKGRQCVFDPDQWKTFVADRLLTPAGGAGCLTLFGDTPAAHEMFADHLTAEYCELKDYRGGKFLKWIARPDRRDNHWLDCLVGATVAASVDGLVWADSPTVDATPKPAAPRLKLSEIQAQKRAARGRV